MQSIIDTPYNIEEYVASLKAAGVGTVIRYYNHKNSTTFPHKCVTKAELKAIHGAGMTAAVVFQQRGGAGGNIDDLSKANGDKDAKRALELAGKVNQPEKSAIYFAVDHDYYKASELKAITPYFERVRGALGGRYLVGVYGSGAVGDHMRAAGLVDHVWLAGATGWSGTQAALAAGRWSLFQKDLDKTSPIGNFGYDGNIVNPEMKDFGQFEAGGPTETPKSVGAVTVYRVIAKSGLNVRTGPDTSYSVITTLPLGTLVTGMGEVGAWTRVDIEGDGDADGFMSSSLLELVSGGAPIVLPPAAPRRPIDIARAELALGVAEVPGVKDNPRIRMYHATTQGGAAPDETAWCSSFANYCVEQAGLIGTDSKWARSWHDKKWGADVSTNPQAGDIVVFRRTGAGEDGGHVGFFISEDKDTVELLGGNQGNRISISRYPKDGKKGPYTYELLSIRRH